MFPSGGFEWGARSVGGDQGDERLAWAFGLDGTDAGDGDCGQRAWDTKCGCGGEEEFVVFASVECGFESGGGVEFAGQGVNGDRGLLKFGGDV